MAARTPNQTKNKRSKSNKPGVASSLSNRKNSPKNYGAKKESHK